MAPPTQRPSSASRLNPAHKRASSLDPVASSSHLNTVLAISDDRISAFAFCEDWSAVADVFPSPYASVVRESLRKLKDYRYKRDQAAAALAKLQLESWMEPEKGTKGARLSALLVPVHPPVVQVAKEYRAAAPETLKTLEALHSSHRKATYDALVAAKKDEVSFFKAFLDPKVHVPEIIEKVSTVFTKEVAGKTVVPNWVPVNGTNDTTLTWEVAPGLEKGRDTVFAMVPYACARVVLLDDLRVAADRLKENAKSKLKDNADVEMADANAPATQASVEVMIERALSKMVSKHDTNPSLTPAYNFYSIEHQAGRQDPSPSGTAFGQFPPSPPSSQIQEEAGRRRQDQGRRHPASSGWEGQGQGSQSGGRIQEARRETRFERTRRLTQVVLASSWVYEHPSSYPDEILDLPTSVAVACLHTRVPARVRQMARFRHRVHVGPGVVVPQFVNNYLSAGLKYMVYTSLDKSLPLRAYQVFKNSLRWKYHFIVKPPGGVKKFYDPDFDTGLRSDKVPPPASQHIEDGLIRGEAKLMSIISAIPNVDHGQDHGLVDVNRLHAWLKENKCLVLMTDKNLGAAVVTEQWYREKCLDLLADRESYMELHYAIAIKHGVWKRQAIRRLASEGWVSLEKNKQVYDWLISRIDPEEEWNTRLPRFYGIPKIHKQPTKMRPIIPCHSTVQGPAAKLLSKILKPIVQSRPYVLESSKELTMALDKLVIPEGKRVFIVTGDVTAFYTNINVAHARDIVAEYCMGYYPAFGEDDGDNLQIVDRCFDIANDSLIFRFENRYFLQRNGLAMGMACSPDIANLYGAKYEEEFVPKNRDSILFYRRYIDDCFALVAAESIHDALSLMGGLKYHGCEIVWEASPHGAVFLDLMIEIEEETNRLSYHPYRKALNHFERIPYASHHPLDVKKGTFVGELSRLAALSSNRDYYNESLAELKMIYASRGYPENLINHWLFKYGLDRWQRRHESRDVGGSVHVLKSVFNPVWEYVDIKDVYQAMMKEWVYETIPSSPPAAPLKRKAGPEKGQLTLDGYVTNIPRNVNRKKRKTNLGLADSTLLAYSEAISDDDEASEEMAVAGSAPLSDSEESSSGSESVLDLINRRMLVSRKRIQTLGDLASVWRREMLVDSSVGHVPSAVLPELLDFWRNH